MPQLTGRARKGRRAGPMGFGLIAGLVGVGLFAFAALILLMSYADELRSDPPRFATALDTSAVGFTGLNVLLDDLLVDVSVDPYAAPDFWDGRTVRLYFLTGALSESRLGRIPTEQPALLVLPKWRVSPIEDGDPHVVLRNRPGLTRNSAAALGSLEKASDTPFDADGDADEDARELAVYAATDIRAALSVDGTDHPVRYLQWIGPAPEEPEAEEDEPAEAEDTDGDEAEGDATEAETDMEELERLLETFGRSTRNFELQEKSDATLDSVLYKLPFTNWLILSEPDLLNNHGIATEDRARLAVRVLDIAAARLDVPDPAFVLDDNLRRRDTDQNLVKLMTRPPFLAATLCLLAAGLLIGWQGFNRFGAPEGEGVQSGEDRITSGPAVLAASAGGFIAGAGRVDDVADRYSDVVRRQVVEALGLSVWDARRVDAALSDREALRDIQPRFAEIAGDPTLTPMTRAARLLRWKEDILK